MSSSNGCSLFSGSGGDNGSREARITAAAMDVLRRLEAGIPVDEAVVLREHPDLLPELGERLRDVRILLAAKQRADRERLFGLPPDPREEMLEEELETLRRALDRYEILERIRYGGQGVVYRAHQRGTKRVVALKVLLDGPLATKRQRYRFEREVELVSRLRHPNIVTVFESGTVRGRLYYAMEFVEGLPIDHYVALRGLTPPKTVGLMAKVCRAVAYAHQNGIIHRDLNPANILVDEQGEPRVYDFGLAKDTWAGDGQYSCSGLIVGTPPYLSPEQAGGLDGKADVRSDVYTLGVVLYELLTDELPYPLDDDPVAIRQVIVSTDPVPLRKAVKLGAEDVPGPDAISRDLEIILAKALAKAKEDRYQSAGDFADDLERYLAGEAVQARTDHALYVLRKTLRKYRLPVTVAALILGTVLVASGAVVVSWLEVRTQRDNARQATGVAYKLFDAALTDIEESVRPLPGGVAVRDRLIRRLADELPELQRLIESDETLNPVLTRLLEKQGDIAHQQGRRGEAARYYEAFLYRALQRADANPPGDKAASAVVRGYRKLAEALDEPMALSQRGLEFGERILAANPGWADTRYELCQLRHASGEISRNLGEFERALEQYEGALVLVPPGAGRQSPALRWLRLRAKVLSGQGLIFHQLGQAGRAKEAVEEALQLREQIVSEHPSDTEARHVLLLSYRHLATLLRDAGQVDQAKHLFRNAADQARFLAEVDPTATTWDRDRFSVLQRLSTLCLETGEAGEAKRYCAEAASAAERLQRLEKGSFDALDMAAHAAVLQGRVSVAEGSWPHAYEAFQRAAAARESLVASDPENLSQLKQLAAVYSWLGSCCRRLDDAEGAVRHRQRACRIHRELVGRQPDVAEAALSLAEELVNLAVAHMALRTVRAGRKAGELLAEAAVTLDELHQSGRLRGLERRYSRSIEAIRWNRAILQRRDITTPAESAAEKPERE